MANKNGVILETDLYQLLEVGINFPSKIPVQTATATILNVYLSDCKYWENPGFVCPLSAYRSPGLFFAQG